MTKIIVETSGRFMLMDPYNSQEMEHNRPNVVVVTPFVESKIAQRDLKVVSPELSDAATDVEFLKYWLDSDRNSKLAIASFLSAFGNVEVSADEKTLEEDVADPQPDVQWTREALEEMAARDGIDGLRDVATPLGVKGRGKEELISEILATQVAE